MSDSASISREDVLAIAELAKLDLTEEEVEMYASQLSEILSYFKDLQEVDTSQVDEIASVLPLKNILREDVPKEPLTPEEVVANAPKSDKNQFLVSAVLDGE